MLMDLLFETPTLSYPIWNRSELTCKSFLWAADLQSRLSRHVEGHSAKAGDLQRPTAIDEAEIGA